MSIVKAAILSSFVHVNHACGPQNPVTRDHSAVVKDSANKLHLADAGSGFAKSLCGAQAAAVRAVELAVVPNAAWCRSCFSGAAIDAINQCTGE